MSVFADIVELRLLLFAQKKELQQFIIELHRFTL